MSKPSFSSRLAVAVWGEKAESKVERKVGLPILTRGEEMG
jgi:hypothetical protein